MTDTIEPLHALADEAGLQRHWRDADGRDHVVPDGTLVTILAALGHKAATPRQIAASRKALQQERERLPAMVVADADQPIALPVSCQKAELTGADGTNRPLEWRDGTPLAPSEPGYYDALFDGQPTRLAVAPPDCPAPPRHKGRPWGVSLQIPSLRGARPSRFGALGELAETAEALARVGADALAINPLHALFPGTGEQFSPYSPSSRLHLNGAMADPALVGLAPLPQDDGGELIAWDKALPLRLAALRQLYDGLSADQRAAVTEGTDEADRQHAIYDALYCRFAPTGATGWQDWPARYRKADSRTVAAFAESNADEVDFHLFVQALTRRSLAEVQRRARAAGMAIGLVSDLAVGVDPGGSDCWALGDAMLRGLTLGAPPDPLGPLGQNWLITSFSPEGLRRTGYAPFIAMIRASLEHAGGIRVDHAFGLARLWVIPEGGGPGDGAYLTYPFDDLMRLLTLEAHLANAFVVAEDLGTAPHGFTGTITARRMLGMRVLLFERAADGGFIGAQDYEPLAVAMTGTHDTPTFAGWWSGTDLDWADRLGRLAEGVDRAAAESIRDWDRGLMWATLTGSSDRPAPHDHGAAVDAAIAHVARTPCALAVVPVEDLLGLLEQPNIPGTSTEHPNWRRRLSAPLTDLAASGELARRVAPLNHGRSGG